MFSFLKSSCRPKVLLLADRRGWAYDTCAHNLSHHLRDRFNFHIRYVADTPHLDLRSYDLVYIYFWGEDFHKRFGLDGIRVIKEVSSHRWEDEDRYGPCTPTEFVREYLADASAVICTSRRLYEKLCTLRPEVYHAPNGYPERSFGFKRERIGDMVIGWAGRRSDPVKRVSELLEPAAAGFRLLTADGEISRSSMNRFYNKLDVYAVASRNEGTPLPLLEAMAAGCFPVCTEVGVVPELITSGENGIIVDPTVASFYRAFQWCRKNIGAVRAAGARNAASVRVRSWQHTSATFGRILDHVLTLPKS